MKILGVLSLLFLFASCSLPDTENQEQPTAPWTYPVSDYQVVKTQSSRRDGKNLTRLVGWDEEFYFFDWSYAGAAITRGTGRVNREQFNLENGGALTLQKGQVTVRNGQVRTLILE